MKPTFFAECISSKRKRRKEFWRESRPNFLSIVFLTLNDTFCYGLEIEKVFQGCRSVSYRVQCTTCKLSKHVAKNSCRYVIIIPVLWRERLWLK